MWLLFGVWTIPGVASVVDTFEALICNIIVCPWAVCSPPPSAPSASFADHIVVHAPSELQPLLLTDHWPSIHPTPPPSPANPLIPSIALASRT